MLERHAMPPGGFVSRHSSAGIAAAAEALFPVNDYGAPDFRTTDMVSRTHEYLEALPREQRRLLTALFVVLELGTIILVRGFRRFSRIDVNRRAEIVRTWRRSSFLALRVLGDAVKATTTIIYMSHPLAVAYIGAYKSCERPGDTLTLRVDREALRRAALR